MTTKGGESVNDHKGELDSALLARLEERLAGLQTTLNETRVDVRRTGVETAKLTSKVDKVETRMGELVDRETVRNGQVTELTSWKNVHMQSFARLREDLDSYRGELEETSGNVEALTLASHDGKVRRGVWASQARWLTEAVDYGTKGGVLVGIGYVAKLLGVL